MGEVKIHSVLLEDPPILRYVLLAVLLWNRLFWFNFFPCSGMTPKVQTVQGERVLLKLGI